MNYTIKRLEKSDLEKLKQLLVVFSDVFEESKTNLPEDSYLQAQLEKNETYIFVALNGDVVIGGLIGYEFALPAKNEKELYLYDLGVDKNYRRQGIASSLMNELKVCAQKNNIALVFVEAEATDSDAVGFYQSQGAEQVKVEHFNIQIG